MTAPAPALGSAGGRVPVPPARDGAGGRYQPNLWYIVDCLLAVLTKVADDTNALVCDILVLARFLEHDGSPLLSMQPGDWDHEDKDVAVLLLTKLSDTDDALLSTLTTPWLKKLELSEKRLGTMLWTLEQHAKSSGRLVMVSEWLKSCIVTKNGDGQLVCETRGGNVVVSNVWETRYAVNEHGVCERLPSLLLSSCVDVAFAPGSDIVRLTTKLGRSARSA